MSSSSPTDCDHVPQSSLERIFKELVDERSRVLHSDTAPSLRPVNEPYSIELAMLSNQCASSASLQSGCTDAAQLQHRADITQFLEKMTLDALHPMKNASVGPQNHFQPQRASIARRTVSLPCATVFSVPDEELISDNLLLSPPISKNDIMYAEDSLLQPASTLSLFPSFRSLTLPALNLKEFVQDSATQQREPLSNVGSMASVMQTPCELAVPSSITCFDVPPSTPRSPAHAQGTSSTPACSIDLSKRPKRYRRRKDQLARQFVCETCGRAYASFYARYAHVKRKHGSQQGEADNAECATDTHTESPQQTESRKSEQERERCIMLDHPACGDAPGDVTGRGCTVHISNATAIQQWILEMSASTLERLLAQ